MCVERSLHMPYWQDSLCTHCPALMSGGAYWELIPLDQIPEIPSSCAQLPPGEEFPQIISVQRADGGHRLALFPSFRQEPEAVTHRFLGSLCPQDSSPAIGIVCICGRVQARNLTKHFSYAKLSPLIFRKLLPPYHLLLVPLTSLETPSKIMIWIFACELELINRNPSHSSCTGSEAQPVTLEYRRFRRDRNTSLLPSLFYQCSSDQKFLLPCLWSASPV